MPGAVLEAGGGTVNKTNKIPWLHGVASLWPFFFFFLIFKIYLFYFIYFFGCVGSSLLRRLSLVVGTGSTLHCGARASQCSGFCCGAWTLGVRAQ